MILFNTTFKRKQVAVPEYVTLGRRVILIGWRIPDQARRVRVRGAGVHRRCDSVAVSVSGAPSSLMATREGAKSDESIFMTVWVTNLRSL